MVHSYISKNAKSATKVDPQFLCGIMQKICYENDSHSRQNARSTHHTVKSSQRRCAWRSTRYTILGDFRVWQVDHVMS